MSETQELPDGPKENAISTHVVHKLRGNAHDAMHTLLNGFTWRLPDDGERERAKGELVRTAEELGIDYESLEKAFDVATLEELSDEQWESMENTDSTGQWTQTEVEEYIGTRRDHGRIFQMIERGEALSGPIVLFRDDKPPYLIGGNTRLLACKALHIKPQILALRM
jgi:hypothetical protein